MKLVSLIVENVKKIKAVAIDFTQNLTVISGKNAQGKSSAIDSIAYALCGKEVQPEKVIREGEDYAKIILKTDQYEIVRHWTSNEKSYLKVTTLDGASYPSPQTLLNKLIGGLSFDPLKFLSEKDQVSVLKKLVGLDFTAIDFQIAEKMESRKLVGRERDRLKMCLDEMPEPSEYAGLPDKEISMEDIIKAKKEAEAVKFKNDVERHHLQELKDEYNRQEEFIATLEKKMQELTAQMNAVVSEIDTAHRNLEVIKAEGIKQKETVSRLSDPDLAGFDTQMLETDQRNRLIRAKLHHSSIENAYGDKHVEYNGYTQEIEDLKAQKELLLATAKFPVPGLSFGETGVLYNNLPLSQASQAEKLRVSFAIAMALNPELKVITVKDASLLDSDNIAIIRQMAEEKDYLVILERVEEEAGSIIIEEGEIKK